MKDTADLNTKDFSFEQPEYKFVPLSDIYAQSTEIEWLIEGYIPQKSIGMLYGPSGVGKTHVALGMATAIANGSLWCTNNTEKGVVLIMAGEGNSGIVRRLKSIEKHHEISIDENNLFLSERAVGIDTDKGFYELISAIEALEKNPDIIIIDTLSRHLMSSSENSNEDMANFINKLEMIKQRYETSIMIVHHTGKNEKSGARGASSIRANIDFSFVLTPFTVAKEKFADLVCEKQKDASDQIQTYSFKVVSVELDEKDSKGQPVMGACTEPYTFENRKNTDIIPSLILETFDQNKSKWQKNFIEAASENDTIVMKPESLKKKFRETVKYLVDEGTVKKISKNEFELKES